MSSVTTTPIEAKPISLSYVFFASMSTSVGDDRESTLEEFARPPKKSLPADTDVEEQKAKTGAYLFGVSHNNERKVEAVTAVTAIVLDVDNVHRVEGRKYPLPKDEIIQTGDALEVLRGLGLRSWVYTSMSHRGETWPRFRVVVEPSRPMTPAEHARIMAWLIPQLGKAVDAASSRPNQMWIVPRRIEGREFVSTLVDGAPLPVDALLTWIPQLPEKSKGSGLHETEFGATRIGAFVEHLESICGLVSLLEIDGHKPVREERGGEYLVFSSPFRSEQTPSFKVEKAKNRGYDYGSGKTYHPQSYLQETRGLTDFWSTIDQWADLAGVPHFDRSRARHPRIVDPTPMIEALPETLPAVGRAALLEPILRAIGTHDTLDQSPFIAALAAKTSETKKDLARALSAVTKVQAKALKDAEAASPKTTSYAVVDGQIVRVSSEAASPLVDGNVEHLEIISERGADGTSTDRWVMRMTPRAGAPITTEIPAKDYERLDWLLPASYGSVRCYPGRTVKSHAAYAISALSTPKRRDVYRDMGWTTIGGRRVFLHAGGAIGCEETIEVRPRDSKLRQYDLSGDAPTDLEAGRVAMREMIATAPASVMGPMIATVVHGLLAEAMPQLGAHIIIGPTGTRKTSLATLAMQLLSRGDDRGVYGLDATQTALESLLHCAGNLPVILDDGFPRSGRALEAQTNTIRSLLHMFFNGQVRRRGTREGGMREGLPPRCSLILTAEYDLAAASMGDSTSNRSIKSQLAAGDVDLRALTIAQGASSLDARRDLMRAFVGALVADPDWVERVQALRATRLTAARHLTDLGDRQRDLYASLSVALEVFGEYAGVDVADLVAGVHEALADQTMVTREERPTSSLVSLLRELLSSGRVTLADDRTQRLYYGAVPDIGWHVDGEIYLEWEATQSALRALSPDAPSLRDAYVTLVADGVARQEGKGRKGVRVMLGRVQQHRACFVASALIDEAAPAKEDAPSYKSPEEEAELAAVVASLDTPVLPENDVYPVTLLKVANSDGMTIATYQTPVGLARMVVPDGETPPEATRARVTDFGMGSMIVRSL